MFIQFSGCSKRFSEFLKFCEFKVLTMLVLYANARLLYINSKWTFIQRILVVSTMCFLPVPQIEASSPFLRSNARAAREERPRARCDFAADLCVYARLASPATRRVLRKMKPKPTSIPVISMTEPSVWCTIYQVNGKSRVVS